MIYDTSSLVENFLKTELSGEVISSLIVMGIIIVLAVIVGIQAHFHDPLKKPTGLLFLAETGVNFFDNLCISLGGQCMKGFGGYVFVVGIYVFLSFIWGLTGLPSPMTSLAVPLSVTLCTFVMIHVISIRYTHWSYFKRYVDPIPVFLPINLISMWAPLLSMSLRMFGNAIAGWTVMSLVYWALENVSSMIFHFMPIIDAGTFAGNWNSVFIAPIVTPILHCYFDLFSGFIQTTVFVFLSVILIGNEVPEDIQEKLEKKGGN